jgi:hypothetical protein
LRWEASHLITFPFYPNIMKQYRPAKNTNAQYSDEVKQKAKKPPAKRQALIHRQYFDVRENGERKGEGG